SHHIPAKTSGFRGIAETADSPALISGPLPGCARTAITTRLLVARGFIASDISADVEACRTVFRLRGSFVCLKCRPFTGTLLAVWARRQGRSFIMNLVYAVERLNDTGWTPLDQDLELLPDGRRFPSVLAVQREFSRAGLELTIKHNLVF